MIGLYLNWPPSLPISLNIINVKQFILVDFKNVTISFDIGLGLFSTSKTGLLSIM